MMVFDALILKCKLSSAREEFKFLWYSSGEEVGLDTMEEASRNGHKRVVLTLFPGLYIAGPNAEVLFKAQVESSM